MINIYASLGGTFKKFELDQFGDIRREAVIWLDVEKPTDAEIDWLKSTVGFKMPPREVFGDIEISSKYKEEEEAIYMNLSFVIQQKEDISVEPVLFFIKGRYMVSIRYRDIPSMLIFIKRMEENSINFQFPEAILSWHL